MPRKGSKTVWPREGEEIMVLQMPRWLKARLRNLAAQETLNTGKQQSMSSVIRKLIQKEHEEIK